MVEYYCLDYVLRKYVTIEHLSFFQGPRLTSHPGNTQAAVNYMLSVSSNLPDSTRLVHSLTNRVRKSWFLTQTSRPTPAVSSSVPCNGSALR